MPRPPRRPDFGADTIELTEPSRARDELRRRGQERSGLRKMNERAQSRGYRASDDPEDVVAFREKVRATREIKPPRGGRGRPVRDMEFEILLQSQTKEGSDDQAAVGTVTITAGENTDTYDFMLEAINGNFEDYHEFAIVDDEVVEMESWWTAFRNCLTGGCGQACLGSLITCTGTWAAYIWCVLAVCGLCGAKCSACATCDCRWWCRWASGCCRQ